MVAVAAGGRQKMGHEKLIIRREKVRLIDILSMLLLRRPLTSYAFVDASDQTARDLGDAPAGFLFALGQFIVYLLGKAYYPATLIGAALEFLFNLVALNGGLLGIVWNTFRCRLVIPNREAPNYRTMTKMIDGRTELRPTSPGFASDGGLSRLNFLNAASLFGEAADLESGGLAAAQAAPLVQQEYSIIDLTVMAAEMAYENAARVEDVVINCWKLNFVGFYNGWNKYLNNDYWHTETTQAFVMTDTAEDAKFVLLAFRGTEMLNMRDWMTDFDVSRKGMGDMGNVHLGFLKALGLQDEDATDALDAFPREAPPAPPQGKHFSYYQLREVLRKQLEKHPNAQIVVTGHSLGGALAVIFPALLAMHEEKDILDRLAVVVTYGQPRVGDDKFAEYFQAKVVKATGAAYGRFVYRYDIVPRVPFDAPPLSMFKHGGECVYFNGWYDGKVLAGDAPNPNYVNPLYLLSKYGNALGDLVKAAFLWKTAGSEYRESLASLLYRCVGLIIPGVASHSLHDYTNAVRLSGIASSKKV